MSGAHEITWQRLPGRRWLVTFWEPGERERERMLFAVTAYTGDSIAIPASWRGAPDVRGTGVLSGLLGSLGL